MNWIPFFFEADAHHGILHNQADWHALRAAFPERSDEQLLCACEATYDNKRSHVARTTLPHFGFCSGCDGRMLSEFFAQHGMEVPPPRTQTAPEIPYSTAYCKLVSEMKAVLRQRIDHLTVEHGLNRPSARHLVTQIEAYWRREEARAILNTFRDLAEEIERKRG